MAYFLESTINTGGADKPALGADKCLFAADKSAVGADKFPLAADKLAVGADKSIQTERNTLESPTIRLPAIKKHIYTGGMNNFVSETFIYALIASEGYRF